MGDIEGLVEVATTTVARVNNGGFGAFGGIVSCIDYALCLLMCGIEYLGCIIGTVGKPRPDIFVGLCGVLSGGCTTLCNFERNFPS